MLVSISSNNYIPFNIDRTVFPAVDKIIDDGIKKAGNVLKKD